MEQEKSHVCCQPVPLWRALGTILTIFLVVFIAVLTWNEVKRHDYIGRENQQLYTINISGEGKVTAIPDIAQVSLGVQTEKSTVVAAQKENTEKMNQIIKTLKDSGVEEKDIATTNYSIYPRYDWVEGKSILRGYTISQNVTVKIRDLEKIGTIVDKAGQLGANDVGGLNFTIDEPEKIKQEAREKALANAKEKAEALAKIAGVKLGKLVSFSESTSGGVYPVYRDYSLKSMDAVAESAPSPDIQAGSQDVIVNVSVTYEVL